MRQVKKTLILGTPTLKCVGDDNAIAATHNQLLGSIACATNNGPECSSATVRDPACWDHPQRVEAHPTVVAITHPDFSHLHVVGGFLLFAGQFVLREITSGALKEAGKEP
jgi:hypothetical protein